MNKIKQNKIAFTLILLAIITIFSSFAILSLPVLFNYKSKVVIIEKNFYKSFKIYLFSSGKISYKPFPRPHLLVENASLNLNNTQEKRNLINTSNLKIFISLKDIYSKSFSNFQSTQISNSNLEINMSDIKEIRDHLYQKVHKPITLQNCKVFLKNRKNEVILISPIKKISFKINNDTRIKNFLLNGIIFGLNFKSEWKRSYDIPNLTMHNINLFNPNIEIRNKFKFENSKIFNGNSQIAYAHNKLEYDIKFNDNRIEILSPNKKKTNFNLDSKIQLNPFYFEGDLTIKKIKADKIFNTILMSLFTFDENFVGNFNGKLKIKFDDLKNRLIKKGEIDFAINEKKIKLEKAKFYLDKIGIINSNISFVEDEDNFKFILNNQLNIENHIEFAKMFQIGSNKIKKVKKIYFDAEKNIGDKNLTISNVKTDTNLSKNKSNEIFYVKNIQNLRSHIRKIID